MIKIFSLIILSLSSLSILCSEKEQLKALLENLPETTSFDSSNLKELTSLLSKFSSHEEQLLSPTDIIKIAKPILNLRHENLYENPDIHILLREYLKVLSSDTLLSSSYPLETTIAIEQAYFKVRYLVDDSKFEALVNSDLPFKMQRFAQQEIIKFDVIYNNDGYSDEIYESSHILKGKPISYNDTPVGYVIFQPKTEVRNIIIRMYGGFQKKDLANKLARPSGAINASDKFLLKNGTLIVELNLPDLLENDINQAYLSKELLVKIHDIVNRFHHEI